MRGSPKPEMIFHFIFKRILQIVISIAHNSLAFKFSTFLFPYCFLWGKGNGNQIKIANSFVTKLFIFGFKKVMADLVLEFILLSSYHFIFTNIDPVTIPCLQIYL